jgi:hypothetical protein
MGSGPSGGGCGTERQPRCLSEMSAHRLPQVWEQPAHCMSPGYLQVLENMCHQILSRLKWAWPLDRSGFCGQDRLRNRTPAKWALTVYHVGHGPWKGYEVFCTSFPLEVRYIRMLCSRTGCRKGSCDLGGSLRQDSLPDSSREKPERSPRPPFRRNRFHFLPERTGYILSAGADVGADCSMLLFWRR